MNNTNLQNIVSQYYENTIPQTAAPSYFDHTDNQKEGEINTSGNIASLPDEIFLNIFKNLSINSIASVSSVCKHWNQLAQDSDLWKFLLSRDMGVKAGMNEANLSENSPIWKYGPPRNREDKIVNDIEIKSNNFKNTYRFAKPLQLSSPTIIKNEINKIMDIAISIGNYCSKNKTYYFFIKFIYFTHIFYLVKDHVEIFTAKDVSWLKELKYKILTKYTDVLDDKIEMVEIYILPNIHLIGENNELVILIDKIIKGLVEQKATINDLPKDVLTIIAKKILHCKFVQKEIEDNEMRSMPAHRILRLKEPKQFSNDKQLKILACVNKRFYNIFGKHTNINLKTF